MTRTETVTSPMLSDPPPKPQPWRPEDPGFIATVEAKFLEPNPDAWFASLGGRS